MLVFHLRFSQTYISHELISQTYIKNLLSDVEYEKVELIELMKMLVAICQGVGRNWRDVWQRTKDFR